MTASSGAPALSLILCARNDQYMGNTLWRLHTALSFTARRIRELGMQDRVDIVVADWGSEKPLSEALQLSGVDSALVSFVFIPREIALPLQKDSAFTEVIALNAAARRARGRYIGRIDQDTLVGGSFLKGFFELHDGARGLGSPLERSLLFSGRRDIPFRFAARTPSLPFVERFVNLRGASLPVEGEKEPVPFYMRGVGIWLMHRSLWEECGGYDERMIYMNGMEANMMQRLMRKYPMVDLGSLVDHDFYHLEHYHPLQKRGTGHYRKVNPHLPFSDPQEMHPNGPEWGLAGIDLPVAKAGTAVAESDDFRGEMKRRGPAFLTLMLFVSMQQAVDSSRLRAALWRRRITIVREGTRGKPVTAWPRVLNEMWQNRRNARMHAPPAAGPASSAGAG